jgi:hypothetical protein
MPEFLNTSKGRGTSPGAYLANQEAPLTINTRGDQSVAQGLPALTELVRLGNSYQAAIATANAFTYVAVWPTTRAELVLYNNYSVASNISVVIDSAWMVNFTTQAAANPIALLGQNCAPGLVAAPTDGTTTIIQTSLSRRNAASLRLGGCLFALANTAFAVANHWDLLVSSPNAATATVGLGVNAEVYGRYIVPPTGAFCLAGLAGTAAGTAIIGVRYHEVELSLG